LIDRVIDERITLKSIFKKHCVRLWTGFDWLRTGSKGGSLVKKVIYIPVPKRRPEFYTMPLVT
jgi:hypothetical protein